MRGTLVKDQQQPVKTSGHGIQEFAVQFFQNIQIQKDRREIMEKLSIPQPPRVFDIIPVKNGVAIL